MTFDEILSQVLEMLQREGRVSYRALKRRFGLDDNYLEDLKDELIEAKRVAVDENGRVLVWVDASPVSSSKFQVPSSEASNQQPATKTLLRFLRTQHSGLSTQDSALIRRAAPADGNVH